MAHIDLQGMWKVRSADGAYDTTVNVPGTVFEALERDGAFGKNGMFYREENRKAVAIASRDFIFEREFDVPAEALADGRRAYLECEGLDTLAVITINGKKTGSTDNMHRAWRFHADDKLRPGKNTIQITFADAVKFIAEAQKKRELWGAADALNGFAHIRKSHCSYGWDWGPQIPDVGIFRPIRIAVYNGARLTDAHITQRHGNSSVTLDIETAVEQWQHTDYRIRAQVIAPDGQKTLTYHAVNHKFSIAISDPKLWWLNGYGAQPLYRVSIDLMHGDTVIDSVTQRIGLRTMTVRRAKDKWGESFEFHVNGVSIFAMGADYIPEDVCLARVGRERTERLIKDCVDANFNSIRVWGGGVYPSDDFYDLCDEYGLVIWHDLMFACATYDVNNPAFYKNIEAEVRYNLTRMRHHASLGLVCGNNEMEWGFVEWGFPKPPVSKTEYLKQYQFLFPKIVSEVCPYVFYWPASPSSGGDFDDPNGEARGDAHYWKVWHGNVPFTDYRTKFFRFMSEFGFESFPAMKTIKTFAEKEDMNIFSPVMEDHQRCNGGNGKILSYIAQYFRYPKDFDSLVYVSQLSQSEAMRYGVEHWRRNRGRCMGAIYWQLNDNWPVASWASVDFYGRWKALHYAAKRFFAPVMCSCEETKDKASIHVSNETREPLSGTLTWKLIDMHGKSIRTESVKVKVDPLSSKLGTAVDLSKELAGTLTRERALFFSFTDEKTHASSMGSAVFAPYKQLSLADPKLHTSVGKDVKTGKIVIEVTAAAYAKFVELDLEGRDTVFSDNYFDLAPGMKKRVTVMRGDMSVQDIKKHLSVRSLFDTF